MGKETFDHIIRKIKRMEETTKKRIGYIDALRGFAMILVVYFHISAYGFGSYETGYNGLIEHLRMPLFFFISGLLFNLSSWKENPQQQFRNKFMALIVPTAIFMILYLIIIGYMNFSFLGSDKKGYWFTFVLFEFIVIYGTAEAILNKRNTAKGEIWVMTLMLVLSVSAFYYAKYYTRYSDELGNWKTILGFFSFVKIRHIIFFWLGTIVRKHINIFLQVADNNFLILTTLTLFMGIYTFPNSFSIKGLEYIVNFSAGLSGTIFIFIIFRKLSSSSSTFFRLPSAILEYIGTRTLDIYLIHYFFLPYHIEFIAAKFNLYENHFLCMLISLALASYVIAISLLCSRIIRFSPFLAKYLLATKK